MYRRSSDWSEHFSQHKEVVGRARREGAYTWFHHPASTPERVLLPADDYSRHGTKSKRSKKRILMAPGPVPSWEKWVLNGWIDPEETTRERLLESLKNNDGMYPWTGYSER
jgi:hypothetical protein